MSISSAVRILAINYIRTRLASQPANTVRHLQRQPLQQASAVSHCSQQVRPATPVSQCNQSLQSVRAVSHISQPVQWVSAVSQSGKPLQSVSAVNRSSQTVQSATSVSHRKQPLQSASAVSHFSQPVQPASAVSQSSQPLQSASPTRLCSQLLQSAGAVSHFSQSVQSAISVSQCSQPVACSLSVNEPVTVELAGLKSANLLSKLDWRTHASQTFLFHLKCRGAEALRSAANTAYSTDVQIISRVTLIYCYRKKGYSPWINYVNKKFEKKKIRRG